MALEPTTPMFTHQATSLRLSVFVNDDDDAPWADADDEGLSAAFFEALRPAIEAFTTRHPNLVVTVTP